MLKIPSSSGFHFVRHPGRVRSGTDTGLPTEDVTGYEVVRLTTGEHFNWLTTRNMLIFYDRDRHAELLTAWGTVQRRI